MLVMLLACELALLSTLLRLLATEPVLAAVPLRAVAETEETDADTDDRSDEADEPAEPVIAVIEDCTEATDDSTEDIDWTAE